MVPISVKFKILEDYIQYEKEPTTATFFNSRTFDVFFRRIENNTNDSRYGD